MLVKEARLAVFDVETTGIDTNESRVVEIGAAFRDSGRWTRRRSRMDPGVPIPKEASAVHGIDDESVAGLFRFPEIWPKFMASVDGHVLSGYNVLRYDIPLLAAEVRRHGCAQELTGDGVIDVMVFVNWHLRGAGRKLTEVAGRYGITPVGGQAHSAAVDCQMTGELLLAMVDGGLIPNTVEEAVREQARVFPIIESEYTRYGTFLYRDRKTNRLRLGAGKYIGELLADVPRSYLQFVVSRFTDLRPDTLSALKSAAEGSLVEEMQDRLPGVSLDDVTVAGDKSDMEVRR